jgi:very-short-patch-repair endonuclease
MLGHMTDQLPPACAHLVAVQRGVIARWQAPGAGLSLQTIDGRLRSGRWQQLHRGVYAAFSGQLNRDAMLWAAVLRAGPQAVLSHQSAAELDRLTDKPSNPLHVTIPGQRRMQIIPGIVLHHSGRIGLSRHPGLLPPRTMIEETVLDLAQQAASLDDALSWVSRACQRGLTTPTLLHMRMDLRKKLRWRRELTAALGDVGDGVHSILEYRYVHGVERPHGLPRARRQAVIIRDGRRQYRDSLYDEFAVCVEVDGEAAHPAEARWRDIRRDNANAADGIITLRYGWADITERPCLVAAEIASVLRRRGWRGQARPCGKDCALSLVS